MKRNKEVYEQNLQREVEIHISKIRKFARDFAINNYELSKSELSGLWEKELKNRGYKISWIKELKLSLRLFKRILDYI